MASSEKNFKCNFCGKSYTSKGILITHLKKIHNERYKAYQCKFCSESFFKKNDIVQHRDISHQEDSNTISNSEDVSFIDYSSEKNFKCNSCGKSFTTKGVLLTHLKNIHNEK